MKAAYKGIELQGYQYMVLAIIYNYIIYNFLAN